MPPHIAVGVRACCVALAFGVAIARAAEPAPSLIGATRDQVLARLGEPKSYITAGNREVILFPLERVVLRDGVVIEDEHFAEAPRKKIPPGEPASAPTAAPAAPSSTAATPTANSGATPTPPAERTGAAGAVPAANPPASSTANPNTPIEGVDPNAVAVAPAEPKFEIKSVRPPGTKRPTPIPQQEVVVAPSSTPPKTSTAPANPVPAPTTPANVPKPATSPAATEPTASTTTSAPSTPAPTPPAMTPAPTQPTTSAAATPDDAAKTEEPAAALSAKEQKEKDLKEKKAKAAARARRNQLNEPDEPDIAEAFLTPRTIIISLLVIGGGIGYLVWRSRQRQLALAATSVSHNPFTSAASTAGGGGATFTPDFLAKLEWKRFEELVAAYYSKTGVVAALTKTGPATPVHIRISWKGEPRPFACVQCLAHPVGLVDAKPLQALVAVLAAEDIRRGYVVTTGKFSVPARDLAEEKHLTLLPGDIFLEKLNALPDTARNEIMQAIGTGDYTTPSCPKCDAKMVRSPDDPAMWRCATHPDQQIPAWR